MYKTLYISGEPTASTSYLSFLKGYTQSGSDGGYQVNDSSSASHPATIDASTTYANVLANAGWLTCTSSNTQKKGFYFLGSTIGGIWDMSLGKTLLLAFQFKSSAAPTTGGEMVGNAIGAFAGIFVDINSSGRPQVLIRDTSANSYTTGHGTATNYCDGNPHTMVILIDGATKKIYFQVDGTTINGQYGSSVAVCTQSTSNIVSNFGFGSLNATTTWDSNAAPASANVQFRNIHMIVSSGTPTSITNLMGWLSAGQNIFSKIPASLI